MSSKSPRSKRSTPQRRKIALACETCREKKVRCDGIKPICGPCTRRSYKIDQCVYKIDNARSTSNEAYLKVLHDRIRELEETCNQNGIPHSAAPSRVLHNDGDVAGATNPGARANTQITTNESNTSVAAEGLLGLSSTTSFQQPSPAPLTSRILPWQREYQASIQSPIPHERDASSNENSSRTPFRPENLHSSPLASHGHVTAMGAISAADDGDGVDSPSEQYYGNSSAASFMRFARDSMPIRSYFQALKTADVNAPSSSRDSGLWRDLNPSAAISEFQFNDFSLPPRNLADHLLDCYWERFYCLYPFFHRPSFERAYESLWEGAKWPRPNLPELNIGLGGSYDSGPQSIVFHCALNAIFALACHFSDIPIREREAHAYSFFLRSKRFIGLDLLDTSTIGVVQTLLVIALLLQSTPYSNRCWNSIGLACRVAQGLGLHEATAQRQIKPLEKEIRRRTWYGCVMMDMYVTRPGMIVTTLKFILNSFEGLSA